MEKFLLDENIPPAIGDFLRERGFDLKAVKGSLVVLEKKGYRIRRGS